MALSYQTIATTLNNTFIDKPSVQAAARAFQNKHGPKGQGEGGKRPYRFGNFYDSNVADPEAQAKWLIDTGTRNWDHSLGQLEDTIRNNLSDTGPQVPMSFSIIGDGGVKARAEIKEIKVGNVLDHYEIILHCRN
jgi:peptidoglycan hydrolase-like protein with peptidoglycan-binding domain